MNIPTLFEPAFRSAAAPGLEFAGDTWSFGRLDAASTRLARLLLERGLTSRDRVAVYMKNRPELIVVYLAAVKAGFIFTPINVLYRAGEIEHILDDAEPKALFCDSESESMLAPLLEVRPGLKAFRAEELAELTAATSAEPLQICAEPAAVATLVYTSGTTGRSKGAMLTHANFAANALSLISAWRITPDDRLLLALPLFHVHGLGNGLHTWLALGYRLRLLERFRKETIASEMLDFQPTMFFGVPTMYERLLATPPQQARAIGGFIRLFVSGSAPLPAATLGKFEDLFGHTILERYGMSETLMNTSNPYDGERRPGAVGPPLPGVSIRVRDPETGVDRQTGETGAVEIKGPNVFSGYWRRDQPTREAFTSDGYFRSGDLGSLSADGYLTLQGRGKELIISGGFNIYPREIEEFLTRLPGIEEAAVVGRPDSLKGEVPTAYIVLGADPPNSAALARSCREGLASFKVPRDFTPVASLPRNALGKVQKHLLDAGKPSVA